MMTLDGTKLPNRTKMKKCERTPLCRAGKSTNIMRCTCFGSSSISCFGFFPLKNTIFHMYGSLKKRIWYPEKGYLGYLWWCKKKKLFKEFFKENIQIVVWMTSTWQRFFSSYCSLSQKISVYIFIWKFHRNSKELPHTVTFYIKL